MNRLPAGDLPQPDLFGHWDAEQDRRTARAAALAEWGTYFRHAPVTIAYESGGGMQPGQIFDGIVCPACGGIEFNDLLLSINHGWSPHEPHASLYGQPAFATCTQLQMTPQHGRYDGIGVVRLTENPAD